MSEDTLIADYQHSPEAIAILDKEGVIRWASPSILGLLGFRAAELEGSDIFRLFYWNASPQAKILFREFQLHNNLVNEGLKQFRTKQGKRVGLHVTMTNLLNHSEVNGIIIIFRLFKGQKRISQRQIETEMEMEAAYNMLHEIGTELHDNIGSALAGARLMVDHIRKSPASKLHELDRIAAILGGILRDIRNLSHGITLEKQENFSLLERLSVFLEPYKRVGSLRIIFRYDKNLELQMSKEQKVQSFRIIQELVTNIVKHAQATKAVISLQIHEDKFRICIRDNGKGFIVDAASSGIGLSNLSFRVNKLGGHYQINSAPGEGTIIWVLFWSDQR